MNFTFKVKRLFARGLTMCNGCVIMYLYRFILAEGKGNMRKTSIMTAALFFLLILFFSLPVCADDIVIEPAYPVPDYVTWLLEIAENELGYTEEKSGYSKYGAWSGDPYAQWCAEYLCWCVDQVDVQHGTSLLRNVYPMYSGSNTGLRWFLRNGRYIARNGYIDSWGKQWYKESGEYITAGSYIPLPGDWVFYSFSDSGDTSHVAMVEYCTMDESGTVTVHVIEGNMPDKVQHATHVLNDWRVLGYGTVYDLADIVIRGGCSGVKVLELQKKLYYLGFLAEQYMTGTCGASTVTAVRNFQQSRGIINTGVAGHETQTALELAYREAFWEDDSNFVVRDEE